MTFLLEYSALQNNKAAGTHEGRARLQNVLDFRKHMRCIYYMLYNIL